LRQNFGAANSISGALMGGFWRSFAGFWRTSAGLWRSLAGFWRSNLHLKHKKSMTISLAMLILHFSNF